MKVLEKRDYIHSHLHQLDESSINEIYGVVQQRLVNKDKIVGYRDDGTPITRKQYVDEIKEAERQIDRGDYMTIEDLEKEAKNW